MAFNQGDVVLVPFPYRDRLAEKTRPAVVVSNSRFNADGDVIVAAITSQKKRHARDIVLQDWKIAGLQVPSTVRILVATMAISRVVLKVGELSAADAVRVKSAVLSVLMDATPKPADSNP